MKGIQGLTVALVLGVIGAVCNWTYLQNAVLKEIKTVDFVGVNEAVQRGQPLKEKNLVRVSIPEKQAQGKDFLVLWDARKSVVDQNVCRFVPEKSVLLRDDIRVPLPQLEFNQTSAKGESPERIMWIPIDTRINVPGLISPGDMVSFNVPRPANVPTRAPVKPAEEDAGDDPDAKPKPKPTPVVARGTGSSPNEILGPFKVLALGNRLSSSEAARANRVHQSAENVLAIAVTVDAANRLEPKAQHLWDCLQAANFQGVGILLHPRKSK